MSERAAMDPARAAALQHELESLAIEVAADPGAACFPRLAQVYREAGLPEEARRVASVGIARRPRHVAGHVVLALALLDLGCEAEARQELEQALEALEGRPAPAEAAAADAPRSATPEASPAEADSPSEDEIEAAFDAAEPEREQMLDADAVAQEAMRREALDVPEDTPEAGFSPDEHPGFATATMASLLEGQGDSQSAAAIRASLTRPDASASGRALEVAPGPEVLSERLPELDSDPLAVELDPQPDAPTVTLGEAWPADEGAAAAWPADDGGEEADWLSTSAVEPFELPPGMDAAEVPEAALQPAAPDPTQPDSAASPRPRRLATLETWLANIRREVR